MATKLKQFGLKNIYTYRIPSVNTIEQIYNETYGDFLVNKGLIDQLIRYYKGDQFCGIPNTEQGVDEKIIVNLTKLYCDTAVAIILTKPIKYISRVDGQDYQDDVQLISDYIMDEGDHETNLQTETDIIIDGIGYQYCLEQDMSVDPTPRSPFTTGRFSPSDTYVVRSYDIGNKVVCSFHIADINGIQFITAFDSTYKYTMYPKSIYSQEVIENLIPDGNFYNGDNYYITFSAHDLPYNPITEFKNDIYGLSTVADLMGLQDSLNTAISNYDNDVLMKIKQILVIIGCEIDDEDIARLKTSGVLNLPASNNSTDNIDAKFVSSQLNDSIITYMNDTIDRMSMIAGCPNQSSNGNAETGIAVEVQNGHTVANFISNKREQAFYKPKREQLGNITAILRRRGELKTNITENDIEIKFDKNRLASVTDNVNNLIQLLNANVEPYDALNVCPIFDDNASVAKKIKENQELQYQRENNTQNEQQNNQGNNTEVQENTVSKL